MKSDDKRIRRAMELIVLTIILVQLFTTLPGYVAEAGPDTWYVPDDYLTIQDAIDNVAEGDIIVVRSGTYPESIIIEKQLTIQGVDKATTIIDGGGTGNCVLVNGTMVVFKNFTVVNSGDVSGDSAIKLINSQGSKVENNNINNSRNGVGVWYSENITVADCTLHNVTYGINFHYSPNGRALRNNISDVYWGILVQLSSPNCTVSINNISLAWTGIGVFRSNGTLIEENRILSCEENGIWIGGNWGDLQTYYSTYNVIRNNTSEDNLYGLSTWFMSNSTVSDNTFVDNTWEGVLLQHSPDNLISSNLIAENHGAGVIFYNSSCCEISGNVIRENGHAGVFLDSSNTVLIMENIVRDNNASGIEVHGESGVSIIDNEAYLNEGAGIEISYNSNWNEISLNNASFNGWCGIALLDSHNNLVSNNNATYNLAEGILLDESSSNNEVLDNICIGNSGKGILLDHADSNIIRRNICEGNQIDGMMIWFGRGNTIVENICTENEYQGIVVEFHSDNNLLKENNCTGNVHGISLWRSDDCCVTGNTCLDNAENGIILGGTLRNMVYDNIAMLNGWDGLYISDSRHCIVARNNASDNWNDGIYLEWSFFSSVYENYVQDNDMHGIYLYDSHGNEIYRNNFINNTYQVGLEESPDNAWDDGAGRGNYWSDYVGEDLDGDGVGDTLLPHNDVDFHPLVEIWGERATTISELRCQLGEEWRIVYPDQATPKPLGCGAAWVSDWLASAFVTTKLEDYVEGLDTDVAFVDQSTGKAVGDPGTGILTFGGQFVNPVVKRAESDGTPDADRAPVKFHLDGTIFRFQYKNGTNIPGAWLPQSVINVDEDLFVIEVYEDGDGRHMMLCYGFGWPGTYAAGKFFDSVVFEHLDMFTDGWIIVHWDDTNEDGFVNNPGEGDTYTLIARGT